MLDTGGIVAVPVPLLDPVVALPVVLPLALVGAPLPLSPVVVSGGVVTVGLGEVVVIVELVVDDGLVFLGKPVLVRLRPVCIVESVRLDVLGDVVVVVPD